MRPGVIHSYTVEADQQEEYGAEQFGLMEDSGLAMRLLARVHRGRVQVHRGIRPYEEHAFVTDAWGKRRSLSRLQTRLLQWLDARPVGARFSQRMVAASLGVSPSSISRTLALFEAFGLQHTDRKRGRYGGTRKVAVPTENLKARAKKAWRRIKHHQEMRMWRNIKWALQRNAPAWFLRSIMRKPHRPLST